MPNCTQESIEFPGFNRRCIQADFRGGSISRDGGVVLLREIDRRLHLSESIADVLTDNRQTSRCTHDLLSLVRQRLFGLALGYADLNDHDVLRDDIALQTVLGREFHGYYDHYCFLPLYVCCQDQLLVSYLRNSWIDSAKHAWAILIVVGKTFQTEVAKGQDHLVGS